MPSLMHATESELCGLFAQRGLRCTRQRMAIFKALASTDQHPTADELYRTVSDQDEEGMSLATVYNTLERFCDVGLAQKLPGFHGFVRYDANTDNHLHIRCEKTGMVRDVPSDLSNAVLSLIDPTLVAQIGSKLGYTIRQLNIELVTDCNCDNESK